MLYKKSLLLLLSLIAALYLPAFAYAASNFAVTDTAGKKHTLSQYKGKWVIVNYWATWCPPCLEEVPDLVALYDSRKNKDVMMLGVALDYQSAKEVAEYVDDMLMSYPIVLGDDETTKQIGTTEVLPTTFIYDPNGELVKTKHGKITKQYLEAFMAKVTKSSAAK